jgi:hypothetical protein
MPDMEPLIPEAHAAGLLGVAIHTLRNWRHRRVGPPYVKAEGAVRYTQPGLRTYVEARTRNAAPRRRPAAE